MTAPIVPPAAPARGLHLRRCARHVGREAAARCPSCGDFFCRECVSEHDGRLLCSACLAKAVAGARSEAGRWTNARRIATAAAGTLVLWLCFAAIGAILLRIPPAFHEGTVWKELIDRSRP